MPEYFEHLRILAAGTLKRYRSVSSGRRDPAPDRDRVPHGLRLLQRLATLRAQGIRLETLRRDAGLPLDGGMTIVLDISPFEAISFDALEWRRDGIEVLSVVEQGNTATVAMYIPDGRLTAFEERIQAYLNETTRRGRPKNASLVNVISDFRAAVFDSLWTEDLPPPPQDVARWYQVWLRKTREGARDTYEHFLQVAPAMGIQVEPGFLSFPERVVVAVYATRRTLESAIELLDVIAEIRSVSSPNAFFLRDLTPADQRAWTDNLRERVQVGDEPPYIALLDTGVNRAHPLLSPHLDAADMRVANAAWNAFDVQGHGSEMAGLALHGDLAVPLQSISPVLVPHRLESVKILPDIGQNSQHLYGAVMQSAVAAVEIPNGNRRRVFAMMTTCDVKCVGKPTEWSATIDQLAFGHAPPNTDRPATRRLFVMAAGNVRWPDWQNYPHTNELAPIEDPAQSWNALAVGAHTQLTQFDVAQWPSYTAIGNDGGLSPSSRTSLMWQARWPYKPDIVAEGGNGCLDAGTHVVVGPEALRVVTTSHKPAVALLTESGDTSAAAAQVARIAAHLAARYPDYWPETLRALLVHGARYSQTMLGSVPANPNLQDKQNLLRRYGYGAVDLSQSMFSTRYSPTLVVEGQLAPYRRDGSDVKMNEMSLHALPWPSAELAAFGATLVRLRITLSYFIDPNPTRRGWQSKFSYQSHGLRFAVKGAAESPEQFQLRINMIERLEAQAELGQPVGALPDADSQGWFFGAKLRTRGSVHSDVWTGTAADLAEKSHVAVYPVGGWWKHSRDTELIEQSVRYSLVISLEASQQLEIDLYSPIAAQIAVPVVVAT